MSMYIQKKIYVVNVSKDDSLEVQRLTEQQQKGDCTVYQRLCITYF